MNQSQLIIHVNFVLKRQVFACIDELLNVSKQQILLTFYQFYYFDEQTLYHIYCSLYLYLLDSLILYEL